MCGFTGFFNINKLNNKTDIDRLFSFIEKRGPDINDKLVINNKLVLLFSRLSILDLSPNGSQPMSSKSGNFTIVFNGEIYNHIEIKKILVSKGFTTFKGSSDTEILLEAIDLMGLSILDDIQGMFSFALYDKINSDLFLVNDRFGEKPLFYSHNDENIFFSSDIKSFNFKKRKINLESLTKFFEYNVISYPSTIWNDVIRIKPSEIIKFKLNFNSNTTHLTSKSTYWNYKKFINKSNDSLSELTNKLDFLLSNTIEQQLNTDVNNGCFLSGGIDSSLITAIASKVSKKKLITISVGFSNSDFDESFYAAKIADYLKTEHYTKVVDMENISKIIKVLPDIYGEPYADSSQIPTSLLCQFASTKIKVALAGDGADEFFGGYDRYSFVPRFWKILRVLPLSARILIKQLLNLLKPFSYKFITFIIQKLLNKYTNTLYFESKLSNLINALDSNSPVDFAKKLSIHFYKNFGIVLFTNFKDKSYNFDDNLSYIENIMLNDTIDYLPNDLLVKTDRASMYFGLEARMPYLNNKVYEFSKTVPDNYKINRNKSKIILKNLLKRYLPEVLYERPKHGFLAPMSEIIRNEMSWVKELLNKDKIKSQGYLDHDLVLNELNTFINGNSSNQYNLWDIIIFQHWIEKNENYISK